MLMLMAALAAGLGSQGRRPADDADLAYWLRNMAAHRYTRAEMASAMGMAESEIAGAMRRLGITLRGGAVNKRGDLLLVLPYPGGRHPRIGFLDGAIEPQRDTKFSVFAPWDSTSYVVVDLPEAIFCNLGLIYLAHTHVPTLWSQQGVVLPPQEWTRHPDGSLTSERLLPNGIAFGASVHPEKLAVRMVLWIRNGTTETLKDIRAQVCVMLKGLRGMNQQTDSNKTLTASEAACASRDGRRSVNVAFQPLHRAWQNPPVPCIHSDPAFPDCPPGATVRAEGRLWFAESAGRK